MEKNSTATAKDKAEVKKVDVKTIRLIHLKAREKNLHEKRKRIDNWPIENQANAITRVEKQLEEIQKEIKAAS